MLLEGDDEVLMGTEVFTLFAGTMVEGPGLYTTGVSGSFQFFQIRIAIIELTSSTNETITKRRIVLWRCLFRQPVSRSLTSAAVLPSGSKIVTAFKYSGIDS